MGRVMSSVTSSKTTSRGMPMTRFSGVGSSMTMLVGMMGPSSSSTKAVTKGTSSTKPGCGARCHDGVGVEGRPAADLPPLSVAREGYRRDVARVEVILLGVVVVAQPEFVFLSLLPVHVGLDLRGWQGLAVCCGHIVLLSLSVFQYFSLSVN